MSDKILKLEQAQTLYQDLRGRIDALPTQNDIPSVPVQDVQVNDSSILSNGVANIPIGTESRYGAVKLSSERGTFNSDGILAVAAASDSQVKGGVTYYKPIIPARQHMSVFYGLAKAAGADMKNSSNAVGTYTDEAKAAIQNMLGITDLISTEESSTATAAHAINSTFMMGGKLHRATAAIAIGDAVVVGTNCEVVKVDEVFVKSTDIATASTPGVVKVNSSLGIFLNSDRLAIQPASVGDIKTGTNYYLPITPAFEDSAVFYGLAKAAGDSTQSSSSNSVGAYTDEAKTAINTMLGSVSKVNLDNAGITARTYTTKFGGQFSVTTASDTVWLNPHARASVTGRIDKAYKHSVTFNGTEYILPTRMWFEPEMGGFKVYEYLGNLALYVSDISGVPGGTDDVPFIIISDLDNNSSIDVLTQTAGTYTILVKRITPTKTDFPKSLIYGNEYAPIEKKDNNGSTYNGFSIGVNELKNARGTFAVGYANKISNQSSFAIGEENEVNGGYAIGRGNESAYGYAFGYKNEANNYSTAIGSDNESDDYSVAVGTDLNAKYGVTAVGISNVEPTGIPAWNQNTSYTTGNLVSYSSLPTPFICLHDHTSSSNFATDFGAGKWAFKNTTLKTDAVFIVGNGDSVTRSNALQIDINGNARFMGNVYAGCNTDSTGGTRIPNDVQVNGASVVSNGVANVPIADASTFGAVKVNGDSYAIGINSNGVLIGKYASIDNSKGGSTTSRYISPYSQHAAAFYGIAKAAGVDMSSSSNAVGTYTDAAKVAIRNMLDATSSNVIAVQDEQPTDTDTKVWLPETEPAGIEVPTYAEFQALDAAVIKKTDIASSSTFGIVKVNPSVCGVDITSSGNLTLPDTTETVVKLGTSKIRTIMPYNQHWAVYYGLSKAAGVDLASETVTVGTYPATASAAIRSMLGAVGDVQVNGTSIVSNGVANIPIANSNTLGTIKVVDYTYGLWLNNGELRINRTTDALIKAGVNEYRPITPVVQHSAVFYGLAKAAGDTTQSVSDNAVGTYTAEAKTAIHTMLGIDPASIAAQVDIPLVETVSGTTPTITGQPNVRYVCGEVSTISITPPASGSVDVIFESGSTATTMTVPSTVKWPAWFDAEALEANTTYEVLITDGIYGSVMTWAT